jgi:hypothetical protein
MGSIWKRYDVVVYYLTVIWSDTLARMFTSNVMVDVRIDSGRLGAVLLAGATMGWDFRITVWDEMGPFIWKLKLHELGSTTDVRHNKALVQISTR